jgi:hypothetical protein
MKPTVSVIDDGTPECREAIERMRAGGTQVTVWTPEQPRPREWVRGIHYDVPEPAPEPE